MNFKYKVQPEGMYDKNDLIAVARRGYTQIAKKLLDDQRQDVNQRNWCGSTALIGATLYGHLETVQMLLEHKADPNLATTTGITALHHAVSKDDIEIMQLLLKYKANPNLKALGEHTALHYAISNEVVEMLNAAGVEQQTQNSLKI